MTTLIQYYLSIHRIKKKQKATVMLPLHSQADRTLVDVAGKISWIGMFPSQLSIQVKFTGILFAWCWQISKIHSCNIENFHELCLRLAILAATAANLFYKILQEAGPTFLINTSNQDLVIVMSYSRQVISIVMQQELMSVIRKNRNFQLFFIYFVRKNTFWKKKYRT